MTKLLQFFSCRCFFGDGAAFLDKCQSGDYNKFIYCKIIENSESRPARGTAVFRLESGVWGMKWLIASDLHGSAFYCAQLLEAVRREQPDRLVLLGDLLYHGPRNDLPEGYDPKQVIEMLNGLKEKPLCVRGNCDTEVDQMVLSFPILADYALLCDGALTLFATHGHRFNPQNPPPMQKGWILLQGHTHVPSCADCGDFLCINPGSVSIPKENSPHGYLTLEQGRFLWKTLEGTVYQSYESGAVT